MSIYQLVLNNYGFYKKFVPNNLSIEYVTNVFEQNVIILPKLNDVIKQDIVRGDVIIPEYLELELSSYLNINDFEMLIHKITFDVEIGCIKWLSVPLRFMLSLKKYEVCDGKIYVAIPFEMFYHGIIFFTISHNDVMIKLMNVEGEFASCKLISKQVYYDSEKRRKIAVSPYESIVQQLSSVEFVSLNKKNEFDCVLPFSGICKGFYVECDDVDGVNEISLKLDDNDRFVYNRFLVRTKCVKISERLLYVPMNVDKSYQCVTNESYEGSVNLYRVKKCVMSVKLDKCCFKICVYSLSMNVLRCIGGIGGLIDTNNGFHWCVNVT